jgi:hypothetical protein
MMNVLLTYLVVYLAANLNVGADAAIAKAMVPLEKNLFRESVLVNITLYDSEQVFIPPGETRTSKTNDDFAAIVHRISQYGCKDKKD